MLCGLLTAEVRRHLVQKRAIVIEYIDPSTAFLFTKKTAFLSLESVINLSQGNWGREVEYTTKRFQDLSDGGERPQFQPHDSHTEYIPLLLNMIKESYYPISSESSKESSKRVTFVKARYVARSSLAGSPSFIGS